MMKCDLCDFESNNREQFAGHRSGHVRRKELPKSEKQTEHICKICGRQFKSGPALGGHVLTHVEFSQRTDDRTRKRHIIQEMGHACQVCHNVVWMNQPIPLTLDHIDGNCDNSERSNLRVICPNCHAQTSTFAGRNRGSFSKASSRKGRTKYYLTTEMRQKLKLIE